MNYKVQIISLLYSFVYGMLFYFFNKLNEKLIFKQKFLNIINLFVFVILSVLIYITILYKINCGVFHIYFLFMVILGFYFGLVFKKFLLKNVKFCNFLKKRKKL